MLSMLLALEGGLEHPSRRHCAFMVLLHAVGKLNLIRSCFNRTWMKSSGLVAAPPAASMPWSAGGTHCAAAGPSSAPCCSCAVVSVQTCAARPAACSCRSCGLLSLSGRGSTRVLRMLCTWRSSKVTPPAPPGVWQIKGGVDRVGVGVRCGSLGSKDQGRWRKLSSHEASTGASCSAAHPRSAMREEARGTAWPCVLPAPQQQPVPTCHIQHSLSTVKHLVAIRLHQPGSQDLRPPALGRRAAAVCKAVLRGQHATLAAPAVGRDMAASAAGLLGTGCLVELGCAAATSQATAVQEQSRQMQPTQQLGLTCLPPTAAAARRCAHAQTGRRRPWRRSRC